MLINRSMNFRSYSPPKNPPPPPPKDKTETPPPNIFKGGEIVGDDDPRPY